VLVVSRAALMLVLLLAVRFMSPSVAVKLTAVKTAKQNLSKAKDAYSAYQQDLAQQQTQLQDLQAKLEADIGFIEQMSTRHSK
jgi:septal ring factor EnvC (AmiA/AmiB activator)